MNAQLGALPIPWAFIDHELMKRWIWRTSHFEATISADLNSFSWEINDLVASPDGRFLTEGRARNFNDAQNEVREAIGKSYPTKYGYAPYAGVLATTFTIVGGEAINFGAFSGKRVVVTVRMPNGSAQSFVGTLRVVHYEVHVTADNGGAVKIQPAHIVKIAGEGGGSQKGPARSTFTGMGRVHTGAAQRGCTGVSGFMPNTVDHQGDHCPVHEDFLVQY